MDYDSEAATREHLAQRRAYRRRELYAKAAALAAALSGEPDEQAADALAIYNLALKIATDRWGELWPGFA